jgi:hypothetical protein
MSIDLKFSAFGNGIIDSRLAFEYLGLDIDLGRDALATIEGVQDSSLSTFETVKSLHRPLDIIPATLHPIG